ncbi:MAG TPA: electron transport complex subunit E [Candidatus Latescibacteria bacterium]|nr:electron transport complex subunit E [Candidatus Latescibacterota bacterium]
MRSSTEGRLLGDFLKGLWKESPTFRLLLGMCPTLAVTNAAQNGFAMGLATTFTLVSASTIVSLIRKVIPNQVRIPSFVVVIATFVTMVDLFLKGKFPGISKALGPYVPLIVVNCVILGRQEVFASRNPVHRAIADALGMGLGFTWALTLLGVIREILGMGSIFGVHIMGSWFRPWIIMILPPGAFLTLGMLIGFMNTLTGRTAGRSAQG